jgi:hypothetical protein
VIFHRRARRLISDTAENIASRLALMIALVCLTLSILASVLVAEANTASEVRRYADSLASSGFGTMFVLADESRGTPLDPSDCMALARISGVRAAIGIGQPISYHLWSNGGPLLSAYPASGDLVRFVSAINPRISTKFDAAQVFVGASLPTLGDRTSPYLLRVEGSGQLFDVTGMTVDLGALGGSYSAATLFADPAPRQEAACVLVVRNNAREHVLISVGSAMPLLAGYSTQWALTNAEKFELPRDRFERRSSQWLWIGAAVLLAVVWALFLRLRRPEYALYSVAGLTTWEIFCLAALELIFVYAPSLLAGLLLARRHGDIAPADLFVGFESAARAIAAGAGMSLALCWNMAFATTGSTLDAIKDR